MLPDHLGGTFSGLQDYTLTAIRWCGPSEELHNCTLSWCPAMIDNWHSSLLWHLVQTACTCLVRNCVVQCIPVHWNQCVNCSCLLQHVVIHAHLALVPVKWSVHNCIWSLVGKVVVHLQFLALRPHIRSELDRNPWLCNLHAYYPLQCAQGHVCLSKYWSEFHFPKMSSNVYINDCFAPLSEGV